ncbi:MAG: hypothetical protein ABIA63_02530, partial [bacterium]
KKHNIGISQLRKIKKVLSSIAIPMSREATFQFVISELAGESIKINDKQLKGVLGELNKS